jgi:RNA 3'-terminal phosphate cyclase (ATP)
VLTIDGSRGEGGGQILRSSLSLSLVTGQPFRIVGIRARRARPGLQRQHLAAVRAAVEVGAAEVEGDRLGSMELTFRPGTGRVRGGEHRFSVGSAGSATLVFQTVLPALLGAEGPSTLVLEGGTHNPMAPPFDFLDRAFLPALARMGARARLTLERAGFYPRGGGRISATVEPSGRLGRVALEERGDAVAFSARAVVAGLPRTIAAREAARVRSGLGWDEAAVRVEELPAEQGPGNFVAVELAFAGAVEVAVGFGERGVRAERVADGVVEAARRYLASEMPVGELLADQLLLPMALAGGGSMRTLRPTPHTETGLAVIEQFLGISSRIELLGPDRCRITLGSP